MSVKVMTWVWDHSPVGGNDRLVLLAIADCASDDGTNAWPSLATLARKTLLDERTVRRIIRRLTEGGHLAVSIGAGPGGTNRYAVLMGGDPPPGNLPPGRNDPPGKTAPPPDTATPGEGGRSRAPRTSLNVHRTSPGRKGRPSAALRGAALPARHGQCPAHRGWPTNNCGPCRSEALGGED